jgi:thioredoxin reductase
MNLAVITGMKAWKSLGYDVIIIGAGPAGLTAAANTSLRGLKSLVIEKQDVLGGLPTILYPDKIIRDHPGFSVGILGKELSGMLFMQAKNAGAEIKCSEEVLKIERREGDLIEVETVQDIYQAKRVILCTGIYDIPRKLEILKGYTGPNVRYKVESPRMLKKKRVVIVGGGDHTFDTAVQLKDVTKSITILVKHRYAKAKKSTVKLAENLGMQVFYNTEIVRIFKNKNGKLDRIQIANRETGEKKTMNVDELFIAIGFEPIKRFLENNGFKLQKDGSVKADRNLQTNIKGVFAAGDVTGEVRLIATPCAEGIAAAVHAFEATKKPYWLR